MMCGLFPRAIACAIMSMPPTKTAHLTPIPAPNASNCSAICKASSRVGESTRAKFACGVSRSSWQEKVLRFSHHSGNPRESRLPRQGIVSDTSLRAAWCGSMLKQLTHTCRMGIAKAPVFPDPVWARPITSLPAKSTDIRQCSNVRYAVLFTFKVVVESLLPTC